MPAPLFMSQISQLGNQSAESAAPTREPGEDAVREYAYHLYQQGGSAPGHDIENWLEATACLKANIPAHSLRNRLHRYVSDPDRNGPVVSSPAAAKRELAALRRGRESLEAAPMIADSDVRTSLFDDRP
jgi:hypothetical protein